MNQQRDVILIFGKQGSGKSTLGKKLYARIRGKYARSVIFDPNHEYEIGTIVDTFDDLIDAFAESPSMTVTIRPTDWEEAEKVFEWAWEERNVLLYIDEAELFIDKNTSARFSYFHKIISFGRHRNIGIIAIGRRVVELNPYLRAGYTELVTFRQTEPQDRDRLEQYGFSLISLDNLPKYGYILLNSEGVIQVKGVTR